MIVAPRNAFPTYKDQKRTVDHVTKVGNAGEVHGNDERRGFTRSSLLEGAEKLVAVARNGHTQESRREKNKSRQSVGLHNSLDLVSDPNLQYAKDVKASNTPEGLLDGNGNVLAGVLDFTKGLGF